MASISIARERSLYSGVIDHDISELHRDISRLREELSTGKRVNRPSDDPGSFSVAERMESLGNRLSRHKESIEAARPWVDRTQEELDRLTDLFIRAHEEGVRAANESMTDSDRDAIAEELKSLRERVVNRLNARHSGEYIFAGNRTTQKPFASDGTPNVSHSAISGERTRPVGRDRTLTINITGKELHQMGGGQTITGALDDLITAVENNNTSAIESALSSTQKAQEHIVAKGSKAGTIARRLDTAKEQLQAATLNAEKRWSQAEDANYAETVADMQKTQTQLQAALKAAATTQQMTLMDYLR